MVGTGKTVLIREVSLIRSVLYEEVPLHILPLIQRCTYKLVPCKLKTLYNALRLIAAVA